MITVAVLVVAFALLVWTTISITRASRWEREENRRWRTRWFGGALRYEEKLGDDWEGIEIETTGRSYVATGIIFRSRERWHAYPKWASERRDEIIARVSEEFRGKKLLLTEEQNHPATGQRP